MTCIHEVEIPMLYCLHEKFKCVTMEENLLVMKNLKLNNR